MIAEADWVIDLGPGGDDQAWLYRDAMRDVWQATPGALDWLKRTVKRRG